MSIFTTAAQNHLSSSVVVFIKVLDINDNVPRLARDYQPYICEGTQAGEVCILWCTDVHDLLYSSVAMRVCQRMWTVKVLILCHIVLYHHISIILCIFLNIKWLRRNHLTTVQHNIHCQLLNEILNVILWEGCIQYDFSVVCLWLLVLLIFFQ